jgi:hypothetical protein
MNKDGPVEQELIHQYSKNPHKLARHPQLELGILDIFHYIAIHEHI